MKITWRKMPPRDARTYTEAFLVVTHCGAPQKDILKTERDPVRPCNFHTIVIRGFLLTLGPFS